MRCTICYPYNEYERRCSQARLIERIKRARLSEVVAKVEEIDWTTVGEVRQ